jgi:hypothetical protein
MWCILCKVELFRTPAWDSPSKFVKYFLKKSGENVFFCVFFCHNDRMKRRLSKMMFPVTILLSTLPSETLKNGFFRIIKTLYSRLSIWLGVCQVLTLASAQLKCELAENQRKDNGQLLVFQTTVSRKTLKSGVSSEIAVFL